MDLAKIVDCEFLYDLELRHPVTDAPIGVVFKIRSTGSDAYKRVLRQHTDRNLQRRIKNKMPKSIQIEQEELEKLAACIVAWDWGTALYEEKKPPELSMKSAMYVLEKTGWIFGQVAAAADNVENFSPASETTSAEA
jgi:hypothetical protein